MDKLKIGLIGVTGRGDLAASRHDPKGRSVVVAGLDKSDEALEKFKANVNADARVTKDVDEFFQKDDFDAAAYPGRV